jgi:hypothetical protein
LYDACFERTNVKEPVSIPPVPQDINELKYRDRGGCATAEVSMLLSVSFERPRILALKYLNIKEIYSYRHKSYVTACYFEFYV